MTGNSAYIGIDPGKNGGVGVIYEHPIAFPYDDNHFVVYMSGVAKKIQEDNFRVIVGVEKVSAMPGQGVTSMFNFGKTLGFIEGVLRAFNIPYQLIPPRTWKKEFSLSSDKNASIEVCQKLFPETNLMASDRSRKPHDGMAEALLIAEYMRRKVNYA